MDSRGTPVMSSIGRRPSRHAGHLRERGQKPPSSTIRNRLVRWSSRAKLSRRLAHPFAQATTAQSGGPFIGVRLCRLAGFAGVCLWGFRPCPSHSGCLLPGNRLRRPVGELDGTNYQPTCARLLEVGARHGAGRPISPAGKYAESSSRPTTSPTSRTVTHPFQPRAPTANGPARMSIADRPGSRSLVRAGRPAPFPVPTNGPTPISPLPARDHFPRRRLHAGGPGAGSSEHNRHTLRQLWFS